MLYFNVQSNNDGEPFFEHRIEDFKKDTFFSKKSNSKRYKIINPIYMRTVSTKAVEELGTI